MTETSERASRDSGDDLQTLNIAYAGMVGTVVIVVVILFVQMLFHVMDTQQLHRQAAEMEFPRVKELRSDQLKRLKEHRWLHKGKVATIPIQDAMKQIADEF